MREEKTELEEKKALEEFRLLKKKTEKRPRESAQRLEDLSQPKIEPLLKRRRLAPFRPINRNKEEEMELGKWLEKAEQRCLRVGMLRERIEKEKTEVLKRMEEYRKRETSKHVEINSGTGNHAPSELEDTTTTQQTSSPEEDYHTPEIKTNVPSGTRKHASTGIGGNYTLLGLIGWWRRVEKEEETFWKTAGRRQQATQSKVSFLATKFGTKLRKATPRKHHPAEKNKKGDQDSPIPTLNLIKDAAKRKYFSDHS